MRSPADRLLAERVLRGAAIAAAAGSLAWLLLTGRSDGAVAHHVRVEGALAPEARDSLAALARAGERVSWSGEVAPLAATSEPVRDHGARTRIAFVGDGAMTIADSLGLIDSLGTGAGAGEGGGSLTTAALTGAVQVAATSTAGPAAVRAASRTVSRTVSRTAPTPGRVLVLGRAGWESKFVIAALEEAGWTVDARLRLADTIAVRQGAPDAALSTATHAAVVVLDSSLAAGAGVGTGTGASAASIARFVRAGGGLVLAGDGAAAAGFTALAPARVGSPVEGERDAFTRGEPRHALPFAPLVALRPDAVELERRDEAVAVAARRVAAGRVAQVGYRESWRWRMEAERDGAAAHRAFWNQMVATVAAVPRAARPGAGSPGLDASRGDAALDEAPRASLTQRLGPSVPDSPPVAPRSPALPAWLGALILLVLLGEWASRRARGLA